MAVKINFHRRFFDLLHAVCFQTGDEDFITIDSGQTDTKNLAAKMIFVAVITSLALALVSSINTGRSTVSLLKAG